MPELDAKPETKLLKLNLGCGPKRPEENLKDFIRVDLMPFEGVDVVMDLGNDKWPWHDESVDETHCSHMLEHLKPMERVHLVNELYRVLKPGAKAVFWVPHWCSARSYGDLTHQWPPVAESWLYHLQTGWRAENAPHETFYKCNFEATWGYTPSPLLSTRNEEYRNFAVANYKDSIMDFVFTITKPLK